MRILMIATSHGSWDPRVVMRESRTLAQQGHKVGLIARHDPAKECPREIELLPFENRRAGRWERIRDLPKTYRMAKSWAADVYHVHELENLLIGILLKWRTGAKLVFDSHECFHHTAGRFLSGWKARFVTASTAFFIKLMARRADHVIVVSFTNEQFYRDYCGCKQVTIIHNSPPPDLFPCFEKTAEALTTITHNGSLSIDRGIHQVLQAIAKIRPQHPIKFLVFGLRDENERAVLEQAAKMLDIEDVVEIVPWLDYDRLGIEMNRAAIGLVAVQPTMNNRYTLHNKLFNYMATGQAVLGLADSDTEQVLERYNCGIALDMTDPNALAAAITTLLDDPERCQRYGLNGRRAVEEDLGWHKMEQVLAGIYATLKQKKLGSVGQADDLKV